MVMRILIGMILVFFLSTSLRAQSLSQDSTRLERYALVIGSGLAFSLLDYVGYNLLVEGNNSRTAQIIGLHLFDAAMGAAINYFLYKTLGIPSAISFDLIWWTWGLDLGFSGWGDIIDPASPWVNRTNSSLHQRSVTWAGWTPIGMFRAPRSDIAVNALYAQAIIGFSVSMAILW